MPPLWCAHQKVRSPRVAAVLLSVSLPAGCQTYTPAPLDLPAFHDAFGDRPEAFEALEHFVARLRGQGVDVPENFDVSDGLSPAEGEVLALFYNSDLRLARLEAGVALANWDNAGLWEDPVFGFDGADILSPDGEPFEWGIGLSLTIPISGRLEIERDRAGAEYEAHLRAIVDAEWHTRATVRTAWARWTAAIQQAALIEDTLAELQHLDATVSKLAELGALNRVERRLFLIELASNDAALTEARLDVLKTRTELLGVLGLPGSAVDLLLPTFHVVDMPITDNTTARLIDANTALAVHFAEYFLAEETLRLEVRKQYPDIVIGSGYGTEFNDHRVMFGISLPIPILNANRAGIAEARAKREVARAKAETTFADLDRRLESAIEAHALALEQRDAFMDRIVPLLNDQMHDLRRIAELGEIDLFVMLETTTRQLEARSRLLALQLASLEAATTAAKLLGPDHAVPPALVIVEGVSNDTSLPSSQSPTSKSPRGGE